MPPSIEKNFAVSKPRRECVAWELDSVVTVTVFMLTFIVKQQNVFCHLINWKAVIRALYGSTF